MIPQPAGWLKRVGAIARSHGTLLIADEVLTGFGRAGGSILASRQEGVTPDFVALAKGLSGGYLPVAATLTTQAVFNAFLGEYSQFRTFFHGHSYTANQLGCAAALASLDVLQSAASLRSRSNLGLFLRDGLNELWGHPNIGDIRQVGLIAGIELVKHWRSRKPFPLEQQAGIRVCEAMARRGVLTRPIGNVLVLMPPYCATRNQVQTIISALKAALHEVFPCGDR
jgi:adenosylmethionine-8-amino-7-oxononanoate aminotransferase